MAVSKRSRTARRTKTGPLSRVQPRLVGWTTNSTLAASAPARVKYRRASFSSARESTSMRTVSPGAILRTISAYAQRMVSSLSGQSVGLCGHPIHVASCVSHSAGMRNPSERGMRWLEISTLSILIKINGHG